MNAFHRMHQVKMANSKKELTGWIVTCTENSMLLKTFAGEVRLQLQSSKGITQNQVKLNSFVKVIVLQKENIFEIEKIEVISESRDEFPLEPDIDYSKNLKVRHLWMRNEKMRALIMIRNQVLKYVSEFLDSNGFIQVQTPVITGTECVCSGSVFGMEYYGRTGVLNQSPWMYVDCIVNSGVEKVYAVMPSFRREEKQTAYHLSELWHIQCDQALITNEEAMQLEEKMICYVISHLLEKMESELNILGSNINALRQIAAPFERVDYDSAIKILKNSQIEIEWGKDLDKEEQTILSTKIGKPFFLYNPPFKTTNFFFRRDENRPEIAFTHDLYMPGVGEVIGGGERISDIDQLKKNMLEFGSMFDEYEWYLEGKKYGAIPHSGFNIGFDRLIMWIIGADDIREAVLFPRIPDCDIKP